MTKTVPFPPDCFTTKKRNTEGLDSEMKRSERLTSGRTYETLKQLSHFKWKGKAGAFIVITGTKRSELILINEVSPYGGNTTIKTNAKTPTYRRIRIIAP